MTAPQTSLRSGTGVTAPDQGEGRGAVTPPCDWAACDKPGFRYDRDSWHCRGHWPLHLEELARTFVPDDRLAGLTRSQQVATLYAEGLTPLQIASALGIQDRQTRRLLNEAGVKRGKEPAKCGTRSGFIRHKDRSEPVCEPCYEADRAYQREYEKRRRLNRQAS